MAACHGTNSEIWHSDVKYLVLLALRHISESNIGHCEQVRSLRLLVGQVGVVTLLGLVVDP